MQRWIVVVGCFLAAGVPVARAMCIYAEPSRFSRTCGVECSVVVLGAQDRPPEGVHQFRNRDDLTLPVVPADVGRALSGAIHGEVEFTVRARTPLALGSWQLERDGVVIHRVEVTSTPFTPIVLNVKDVSEERSDGECNDTGPGFSMIEPDVRRERPLHLVIELDATTPLPADVDMDLWILPEGTAPPTEDTLRDGTAPLPSLERFRPAFGMIRTRRVANQPVARGGDAFIVALRGVHQDGSTMPLVQRTFKVPTARVTCDCTRAAHAPFPLMLCFVLLLAFGRRARLV